MSERAINTRCPWSNDPVSVDATTSYRGHTIGFCNPGYRDKFEKATSSFDESIAIRDGHSPSDSIVEISSYEGRYFRFDNLWQVDETTFKTYLVTTSKDREISPEMLSSAKRYVDLTFPSIRKQEQHDHGLGYIILHAGKMGNWLLIHWWAYEDIALRMLASAELNGTEFKSEDHRRFHACVWEHVIIDHERNAWVKNMMTSRSCPALYLSDRLIDGEY